jgi:uncharacterized protein YbcV (DUF1398 family)
MGLRGTVEKLGAGAESHDSSNYNTPAPLESGTADVPVFNCEALIAALRTDQAFESTFPEFLAASWRAGVVRYDVDFAAHTVAYFGCNGEEYIEAYPAVDLKPATGA